MGAWTLVLVYLAAFVLLQLAVYRYLRGRDGAEAGIAFAGPPNTDRGPGTDPERGDRRHRGEARDRAGRDGPFRRCPNCGETNDPDGPYTFCRNCATRLPG
jgi:hypothetical protein